MTKDNGVLIYPTTTDLPVPVQGLTKKVRTKKAIISARWLTIRQGPNNGMGVNIDDCGGTKLKARELDSKPRQNPLYPDILYGALCLISRT